MSTESDPSDGGWTLCPPKELDNTSQYVYYLSRYGPTQLIQFGFKHPVTDVSANPFNDVKRVIFFIPGNPGPVALYKHFLTRLYQNLGIPIIALTHVGMMREGIARFKAPLTVRKLVEHKIDFIENVISEDVEIVLIGHSIGTFISLQIMRMVTKRERFVHNIMLMPVLEKFTQTPGWKSMSFFMPVRGLLYAMVMLLSLMKDEIALRFLPYLVPDLKRNRTPECVYEGCLQLVDWHVVRNILTLTRDEANQVQDRDDYFLYKNLNKFSLLYCVDDKWSPMNLYRGLKRRFPECYTEVMDTVTHSFVTDKKMTEEVVARIVKRYQVQAKVRDLD